MYRTNHSHQMASLQKGLSQSRLRQLGLVSLCPQRDDSHDVLSVLSCHEWQGQPEPSDHKFLKSQVVFHNKRSREGTVLVCFFFCSLETHWLNQQDGKIATAISNKNNQPQQELHLESSLRAIGFEGQHQEHFEWGKAIFWRHRT